MSVPGWRPAALVLAGALALGGCSGASGGKDADPSSSGPNGDGSSPTYTQTVNPNDAYGLDVPKGIELTALGSDLKVGQTAQVAWEPDKKTVGVIALTPTKLRQGTMADFSGFTLNEQAKQSTPYYVDARVKNIGRSDLSGVQTPLYLVNGNDVLVEQSTFQSTFKPCAAQPLPKKFKPGDSTKVCLVFVAADHGKLKAVSFRPTQDFAPIDWTGPVAKPKKNKKN